MFGEFRVIFSCELYCVWGVQSYFSWAWYFGEERRYNEVEKAYNREYMLKAT